MNTLREAKIGQTVKVVKLHGEGAVKLRKADAEMIEVETIEAEDVQAE